MKLYIKQKVFSWRDRFTVRDENDLDVFTVEGEVFSLGKKLHIYNAEGREAAYIEEKVFSFKPRYYIHLGSETYQMVKDFTFLRPSYRLEGLPWKLEGDFMAHEYNLANGGQSLMRVYKEWFTWGDSYALDISEEQNALLCLCIVLVMDCATDRANNP